jgi:NAD(P)-dependent dehydrogenase (short-subunit alcohol dehydrogenase family)
VIATHRRSETPESLAEIVSDFPNVRVERLDVADLASIKALATKLEGVPIDVLINNAGVYSDRSACREEDCGGKLDTQRLGSMDYELFDTIMTVNVRGALAVSEAFIENIRASTQKKLISLGSTNGSLTVSLGSGAISYRASKAALHRVMQLVALAEEQAGVIVVLLHPGAVLTERQLNLFGDGYPGVISPEQSVSGMIEQIEKVSLDDTGHFIQYDGSVAPW